MYTSDREMTNEETVYTFKSKRNAFESAKKLPRRIHKPVSVYMANLNDYSMGTGCDVDINRYGIFKEWKIRI